jgi:putative drug exporter of the RND superfamily
MVSAYGAIFDRRIDAVASVRWVSQVGEPGPEWQDAPTLDRRYRRFTMTSTLPESTLPKPVRRRRWTLPTILLVAWLLVGGVVGPFAGRLTEVIKNDNAAFLPANAESTKVIAGVSAITNQRSPIPALLVVDQPDGVSSASRAEFAAFLDRVPGIALKDGTFVGDFLLPFPLAPAASDDGKAMSATLLFDDEKSGRPFSDDTLPVNEAVTAIRGAFNEAGIDGHVGGFGGILADFLEVFGDINGKLLLATIGIVSIILILVYRSPFLWLVPLSVVLFGDSLAQAVVYFIAREEWVTLNGQAQGILLVLVFGVGTDYSLLLVSRFREELHYHESKYDAMRRALVGVREPIIASGATVAVGLLCLLFSELNSNKSTGPVAAIGVMCAMVAVLTLLPALLVLLGRRVFWPFIPKFGTESHLDSGIWAWIARVVGSRPRRAWVLASFLMLLLAAFVPTLKADGIAQIDAFTQRTDSVVAQDILNDHFPAGEGSPAQIIAPKTRVSEVISLALADPGVASAAPYRSYTGAEPIGPNTVVDVILQDSADSVDAAATVKRLRIAMDEVSTEVLIGGYSAINLDTQESSKRDVRVIIPIVLIVIFFILALLLRAVIAPMLLIGSVLLSFVATLGLCAFFFNNVFGFAGADSSFPLFAFTFLVALGVDYNIFLMTRVREETLRIGTRLGVLKALTVTGGVITSAGVVLAATFAVLGILPLVFLAQLGFAVAVGVLIDTIIVRSVIVPALVHDLGAIVWWPSKLARESTASEAIHT